MKVNSKGTNACITANILSDEEMRKIGFTDYAIENWYYCKTLYEDITFNVTIPKDGSDIEIITLDERFCQPYDYQYMLERGSANKYAIGCRDKVEAEMEYLKSAGVLSGHIKGEYI